MKHNFFLLLCLWVSIIEGQSVSTALNFNKPEDLKSGYPVSEITVEMIFYKRNGSVEKKKEISILNPSNNIISELRYDENGILTARLTRLFDSTGTKSLGRKFERWHKVMGHTSETSSHEYDANGYLIKTTEKNQYQEVIMVTHIKNDEYGNSIEVITTDGQGNPYGLEKAEYDYANNKVITRVYNSNGELLSESSGKINYDAVNDPTIIKNEQGDVTKTEDYEYDYRYDKKENWTKKTSYKIKDGKRVKQSEFFRKIKYRK